MLNRSKVTLLLVLMAAMLGAMVVLKENSKFILIDSEWSRSDVSHTSAKSSAPRKFTGQTFYEVALKYGTDKVTTHQYHHIYQKYIAPVRTKPLRVLEIGLGCNMPYGPGASLYTWLEWLPRVTLFFIDFNGPCVEKWKKKMHDVTVFVGDQANITFLEQVVKESGGNLDIVVDDGGHGMVQQINSFNVLFGALKPGGHYFIEDMVPTYYNDSGEPKAMMTYANELMDDLIGARMYKRKISLSKDLFSIDCMAEICCITKIKENDRIVDWAGQEPYPQ